MLRSWHLHPVRSGLGAAIVLLAGCCLSLWALFHRTVDGQVEAERMALGHTAQLLASQVDGDLLRTIRTPGQETTPPYERAVAPLQAALRASGEIARVHTLALIGDQVVYVLDAGDPGSAIGGGGSHRASILEPCTTPSTRAQEALRRGVPTADEAPIRGVRGNLWSGYAPVFDSGGGIAGVVRVDARADRLEMRLATARDALRRGLFLAVLLSSLFGGAVWGMSIRARATDIARGESERRSRDNEELYRSVYETAPLCFVLWDRDCRIQDWNREAERLFGWTREEVIGRSFYDLTIPEGARPQVEEVVRRTLEAGLPRRSLNENLTRDGRRVVMEWNNAVVRDDGGGLGSVLSLGLDVTGRVREEEQRARRVARVERQNAALMKITSHDWSAEEDYEGVCRQILELVAHAAEVERVGVWELNAAGDELHCRGQFERTPERFTRGAVIREEAFRDEFRALVSARFVDAHDARTDPRTRGYGPTYLVPNGITSMLDLTLRLHGRVTGALCLEHVGPPRHWEPDEIAFATVVADQLNLVREGMERRRLEDRARRLSQAVDAAAEGIVLTDRQGLILAVNPAFTAITGYAPEEVVGRNPRILKSARQDADFYRSLWRVIASGEVWRGDLWNRRKDGTDYEAALTISAVRDERGQIAGYVGVQRDVTAEREAERALATAREYLQMVVDTAATAVFSVDADQRITGVNEAFCRTLGYRPEEIIGRHCHIMGGTSCLERCGLFDPERRDPIYRRECAIHAKDGSRRTVLKNATLMRDAQGKVLGGLESFADVTELALAREAAESAARAKNEFLANVSHELRTPLNGIIGLADLLRDTPLDAAQRDHIEMIRSCGDALLTLINDILDLSKIEAGKLDLETIDFDLRRIVEEVAELLTLRARQKNLELAWQIDPGVPPLLRGDPVRLRQVLLNLAGNAVKFTETGGVRLAVGLETLSGSDAALRFSVSDTGIGVSPRARERLFESFSQGDASTTRKYGGTGLGLAISKRLVGMMHGRIGVESEPGRGSTFWFTALFRRSAGSASSAPSAAEESASDFPLPSRPAGPDDDALRRAA